MNIPIEVQHIPTAWRGHEPFAIWLVQRLQARITVDLGVDSGFSTFSFATPNIGTVYGIDHFQGDGHAGYRNTYDFVMGTKDILKNKYGLDNIQFIQGDFTEVSKTWTQPIDILHIDGFHSYDSTKADFLNWLPHLQENGVLLMHDVTSFPSVKQVYDESNMYRCFFSHSAGLGVLSRNKEIIQEIASLNHLTFESA
ncbi:Methyltransferase domain-containing protein [Thermoactinomyces sp. DSM 45891]|uniref:class I SAM-dependent methyltransferase n=1 Tax=Thermoactinomyces sp. DSM 45891 TaxID=1761907 RepID=UPI000915CCEB|nr:class I SAM-dependent methyltransferase [Thermoactinomyces sp. DSM 45891]SFX59912.1 Methyltransferase domain-containing protein [Thermoactinomyces sp. DSM 45891]